VVNYLELYTRWVGRLGSQRHTSMAATLARRWCAQMILNAALIAGVFIAAAFVGRRPPGWLTALDLEEGTLNAALWLAAVVVSLPMLIATARKLQALGLLIAETRVTEAAAGDRAPAIRAFVAQAVPIVGTVVLGLYVLVLSAALLPPFKVLIVLLVLVGLISWLLWRSFIRVYSRAQFALQETLARAPAPQHDYAAPPVLHSLLREADVESVALGAESPAAGKRIRELELRTRTGASIVGIERAGANIINPGPDEELQSGDQVLLLGTRFQLDAARAALSSRSSAA
jgi:CPA2 family monovalent cation:H+ antiporter-2